MNNFNEYAAIRGINNFCFRSLRLDVQKTAQDKGMPQNDIILKLETENGRMKIIIKGV